MPVKELTISGDLAAVEAFKKLFSQLDLNLEEQLAPIIGDAFAFKLGKTLQQAANLFKKTTLRMRDNSREFLQEETLIVPPAEMVEDFANDIQKLNRDIDRLTHRVKTLVNRE
jgi:ubiquinone biosynthesis protein UbiJ